MDNSIAFLKRRHEISALAGSQTRRMFSQRIASDPAVRAKAFCDALDATHTGQPYNVSARTGAWWDLAVNAADWAMNKGAPPDAIRFLIAIHLDG